MIKNTMQKQQIESAILFDQMASSYTEDVKAIKYVGPSWLLNNFDFSTGGELSVLDLGCGNGLNGQNLLEKNKKLKLTGLDISPEMIFEATKLFIYENLYHQSLDEPLSFAKDKSFERIIVLGCLEFISKIDKCLNEISRVLKPEAFAYLSFQVFEEGNDSAPRQTQSGDLLHFAYSKKEIEKMLTLNGLHIISMEQKVGYNTYAPCPYFFIRAQKVHG